MRYYSGTDIKAIIRANKSLARMLGTIVAPARFCVKNMRKINALNSLDTRYLYVGTLRGVSSSEILLHQVFSQVTSVSFDNDSTPLLLDELVNIQRVKFHHVFHWNEANTLPPNVKYIKFKSNPIFAASTKRFPSSVTYLSCKNSLLSVSFLPPRLEHMKALINPDELALLPISLTVMKIMFDREYNTSPIHLHTLPRNLRHATIKSKVSLIFQEELCFPPALETLIIRGNDILSFPRAPPSVRTLDISACEMIAADLDLTPCHGLHTLNLLFLETFEATVKIPPSVRVLNTNYTIGHAITGLLDTSTLICVQLFTTKGKKVQVRFSNLEFVSKHGWPHDNPVKTAVEYYPNIEMQ